MHTYRRDIFPVSALVLLGSLAFVRLISVVSGFLSLALVLRKRAHDL